MSPFTKLAVGIAWGALSLTVSAQETAAHDTPRHVDAHVHGHGELNFAVEGSEVHLELKMPANDVLGFESITNDNQRHQLHEALEKLEASSLWSMSPAASCKLISAKATSGSEDHDHGHEKNHHNDHDEHGHEGHKDEGGHMDISATYVFECGKTSELDTISTSIFEVFERSQSLSVQGFTQKGQAAAEMTKSKPEVRF
ncbi:DUF2796 domain-containing protein [Endozoicomonas numazuensis]|uniref:Zinc-binding protein n=1 Tax=Endozoicomonas numazuensis TaxID=1137799 RepID=A0A081NK63_9GAMM|nr:DUF2796 domain-containing protein [Endozoicomonas numazuensis]KEQ18836.1 hypothetical protein GZ78_01810 [Endozoicomonas numazuensis]